MIWAMILAAGESRRMGKVKLLLPYGQTTMIEAVVRNALLSRAEKTLVVLGANWQRIRTKISYLPVKTTVNTHFRKGMLSSVQWGVKRLPSSSRAVVVMLADQPAIPPGLVDSLIEAYEREEKGLVIPVYQKKRGHPLLIDLKYRKDISRLHPGIGLRELLKLYPEDILEVPVADLSILRDIDDASDYRREAGRKRKSKARV